MTRRATALVLSQLLLACAGAGENGALGTTGGTGAEAEAAATGTTADGSTTTGEPDDDSGSSDSSSGGSSSSGPDCTPLPWFPDADGDGFGPDDAVVMTCEPPPNHVPNGGDCNDQDAAVNIAVEEVCDQVDNNCDGLVDEPTETNLSCGGCSLFEADTSGYYAVCPEAAPWSEAQAYCQAAFGGTLVVINTEVENTAVVALGAAEITSVWLGLSDLRTEGTFVWADGTPLEYTNWNTGEPNDAAANEDCAHLSRATGVWNDLDCAVLLPYICEVVP